LEFFNGSSIYAANRTIDMSKQFYAGSISKWISSLIIAQFMKEGLISINEPVSNYIPTFKNIGNNRITIKHLLTHTSGLDADNGANGEFYPQRQAKPISKRTFDYDVVMGSLQFTPGSQWSYSSLGYIVLGKIISHIGKKDYKTIANDYVLEPLGLSETMYVDSELQLKANLYIKEFERRLISNYMSNDVLDYFLASGGLITSTNDLRKIARYFLGLDVSRIPASLVSLFKTPLVTGVSGYDWNAYHQSITFGLGTNIGKRQSTGNLTIGQESSARSFIYIDFTYNKYLVGVLPFVGSDNGHNIEKLINTCWLSK
jgi:CubicO group peptidase (beta-lactamase class C family)